MNRFIKTITVAVTAITVTAGSASALQYASRSGGDPKIATYKYSDNEVYGLYVSPLNITYIEFPRGERVQSIGAGDTESYEFHRLEAGNVVTVKPSTTQLTPTNMTIISNRRTYSFKITPRAQSGYYRVSFQYPPEPETGSTGGSFTDRTRGIIPTGSQLNRAYVKSGEASFAPVGMWDDGVHTYIQFSPTQPRPAVFRVDAQGFEETVNVTQHPDHLIQIHGLSPEWTLRIGNEAICIDNETMHYPRSEKANRRSNNRVVAVDTGRRADR